MQPLLFEKSFVHFPTLVTFESFIASLPEERWKQLRHISLAVTFPYLLFNEGEGGPTEDGQDPSRMNFFNSDLWTSVCGQISEMHTLKTLTISMYAKDYRNMHSNWPARPSEKLWNTMCQPMMGIRCLDDFQIEVSWPLETDAGASDVPFHLKTKGQSEDMGEAGEVEDATESNDGASSYTE